MRLTFSFRADVTDRHSDRTLPAPASIDGLRLSDVLCAKYLDDELADLGIVGGEIHAAIRRGKAVLDVRYWIPDGTAEEIIERLREDTKRQLDDGIGECGFDCETSEGSVIIWGISQDLISIERVDDGVIVKEAPRIPRAARDGNIDELIAVIESDEEEIDVEHQGYTALQLAILSGKVDAVRILLDAGADANRVDEEGATPLELCALARELNDDQSRDVAEALLKAGADPLHTNPSGYTAKSYAELRGKTKMAMIV
jgi:hypothetical protein